MALADTLRHPCGELAAAGYRTLAVTGGGLVHPAFGLAQGFDRYISASESADEAVRRSLDLLREHRNEPVFLFFHTYQVHEYVADEDAARDLFGGLPALGPDWRSPLHEFVRRCTAAHPAFPAGRATATTRRCGASTRPSAASSTASSGKGGFPGRRSS